MTVGAWDMTALDWGKCRVPHWVAIIASLFLTSCGVAEKEPPSPSSLSALPGPSVARPTAPMTARTPLSTTALPFLFEKNQGQKDGRVSFFVRHPGFNLFLTEKSIVTVLSSPSKKSQGRTARSFETGTWAGPTKAVALHLDFVNANPSATVSPVGRPAAFVNVYEGNIPSNWKRKVPSYSRVRYDKLYPDTDLWLSSANGQLSYYFTLGAGGSPDVIGMKFKRAQSLKLDGEGNLEITLSNGRRLIHQAPKAFDQLGGNQRTLRAGFRITGADTVGFRIKGRRPGSKLTIDPIIDFGTYFGGGSDESTVAQNVTTPSPLIDLAVLEDGDLLIGGTTLSTDLPEATGTVSPGRTMAFAARLDPDNVSGGEIRYVSYISGTNSDSAHAITVGPSNGAYLCGETHSPDFPTPAVAFDVDPASATHGAGFVVQLDPDGEPLRTTFMRAARTTRITDCVFENASPDASSGLYFTGLTVPVDVATGALLNPNLIFPGAPQTTFTGERDALVGKLSPTLETLEYFTLLGGRENDLASAIAVKDGFAVITGISTSPDFPITGTAFAGHTINSVDALSCGDFTVDYVWECRETFVARVNRTGTGFDFVTFLNEKKGDNGHAVSIDENFDVYVAGTRRVETYSDGFVVKLKNDGASVIYRTIFGGDATLTTSAFDMVVDSDRVVHLTGKTKETGLGVGEPLEGTKGAGWDGYYARVDPYGDLDYFTYLGGDGFDAGYSLALAGDDCVYVGLDTRSDVDIPLPGASQSERAGATDILILRHCAAPPNPTITKEVSRNTHLPGEPVTFDIIVDNPGPWQRGDFTIRDAVNLPLWPIRVIGPIRGLLVPLFESPDCRITGDTVSCTLRELRSGTTTFKLIAENRLTCTVQGQGLSTIENTAWLFNPDGSYNSNTVDVEYFDCLGIGEECSSSQQCGTGLVCVKPCVSSGTRPEYQIHTYPRCATASGVNACDQVLP